jgi:hypothetical protein
MRPRTVLIMLVLQVFLFINPSKLLLQLNAIAESNSIILNHRLRTLPYLEHESAIVLVLLGIDEGEF